jgi:hypothetical protein
MYAAMLVSLQSHSFCAVCAMLPHFIIGLQSQVTTTCLVGGLTILQALSW